MKKRQPMPFLNEAQLSLFRKHILKWFAEYGRTLPWRGEKDPYRIWVSEVILQQTQVVQGWDYYLRFIEKYPDVRALAHAEEAELLLLWQGLGYYSRAHNMLVAARQIEANHQGHFPKTAKEVSALKGIGPYTTAAIMSIAYNEPLAVVDGNVYRIISRVEASSVPIDTSEGQKIYRSLANDYLDVHQPGAYNQAMMDLGATICTPKNPRCDACPIASHCLSCGNMELIQSLPVKAKKVKVEPRYLDYFLLLSGESFWVEQRDRKGIWKGLYQLPLLVSDQKHAEPEEVSQFLKGQWVVKECIKLKPHRLSHRLLEIHIHVAYPSEMASPELPSPYQQVAISQHSEYAFPKPLRQFLDKVFG